jgi:hypothetical protein
MLHPSGAQTWGAHLGRPTEDTWRGFVALEGHPVGAYEELIRPPPVYVPFWPRSVSPVEDLELSLAEAGRLFRLLITQEHALGDYLKLGYIRMIESYCQRARGHLEQGRAEGAHGDSRMDDLVRLERGLGEVKGRLEKREEERKAKFEERGRERYTGHDVVFAEPFARLVRKMQVKVVVLTTCRGAVRGRSRWGGLAAALLRTGVPVVVGMQYSISVEAARRFSFGFYDSLARGESIDEAVSHGRKELMAQAGDEVEGKGFDDFGMPVVYSRMTRTDSLRLREIR